MDDEIVPINSPLTDESDGFHEVLMGSALNSEDFSDAAASPPWFSASYTTPARRAQQLPPDRTQRVVKVMSCCIDNAFSEEISTIPQDDTSSNSKTDPQARCAQQLPPHRAPPPAPMARRTQQLPHDLAQHVAVGSHAVMSGSARNSAHFSASPSWFSAAYSALARRAQQLPPDRTQRVVKENEMFVIKKEHDSPSNGKYEELTIYKQNAVCRHCWKLIKEESHVLINAQCKCTKISLIHDGCKDEWSQEQGEKCSYCGEMINSARVVVSSKISGENSNMTTERRWWRF